MKRITIIALGAVTVAMLVSAATAWLQETPVEQNSYGVGFLLGEETRTSLDLDGVAVDRELVTMGFRDGLTGAEPFYDKAEVDAILEAVHREMEKRQIDRLLDDSPGFRKLYDENLRRSDRFHQLFGKQDGVVTLPDGLQYVVLETGTGRSPRRGDTVVINAQVKLLDGTVAYEGKNAEVQLKGITEGAIELLQKMKEGGRRQFAIPPQLAHGRGGRYPDIGPNETLTGMVELLRVKN
jgi:FKBP-type peptidyl-prolyl cis-trans isomerase FklB